MNVHALRRALHASVDLILDALVDDQEAKPKRRRGPMTPKTLPPPVKPPGMTDEKWQELKDQVDRQLRKAGYVPRD